MDIIAFLLAWSPEIFRVVLALAISILVLSALRRPMLWYFGISRTHQNQKEIIELLEDFKANRKP